MPSNQQEPVPRYWWCRNGMVDDESLDGMLRLKTIPPESFIPTADYDRDIKVLQDALTHQYDAYMDALKSEHDAMLKTGRLKTATGTTRAMIIIGEIHDAELKETANANS